MKTKIIFSAVLSLFSLSGITQNTFSFTINNLSPTNSITCANPSVNLVATSNYTGGPISYAWIGGPSTLTGSNVNITAPAVYIVTATAAPNFTYVSTITIGVNTIAPTSTLVPSVQMISCNGIPATFTATSSLNSTHMWLSPYGGTVFVNTVTVSVYNPSSVGTYTHFTKNNINGCIIAKTITVTSLNLFPTFNLASSSNFTFGCLGVATASILNPQSGNPGAPVTYTMLSPGTSSVLSSGPLSTISNYTLNSIGVWTVVVRDNINLCDTRSQFSVIQNTSSPVITLTASPLVICAGNPVILNASGANTYTWSGGITNGVAFNPTITTSYSVQGTNTLNGCINTIPVVQTITVNPLPVININSTATTICAGNTLALTASGANSYSWSGGISNAVPFSLTTTTNYIVTGTNTLTGCSNTVGASVTISVNPIPIVSVTSINSIVCNGNSITLAGQGASTYAWSGGITNGMPFIPSSSGSYTVTGTDANGCINQAVQTISLSPIPTITVSSNVPIFCGGMNATLTASGANTYNWVGGGGSSSLVVNPPISTTYTVIGTGVNNCTNTGIYSLITSTQTSFNYTISGLTATFVISNPGGCSPFVWDFGNGTPSGINYNPVITFTPGTYGICLKCTALPEACIQCLNLNFPDNLSGGVGIKEIASKTDFDISPNPNNGHFTITYSALKNKTSKLNVYNSLGQLIQTNILEDVKTELSLPPSAKGIYQLELINDGKRINKRLIVE